MYVYIYMYIYVGIYSYIYIIFICIHIHVGAQNNDKLKELKKSLLCVYMNLCMYAYVYREICIQKNHIYMYTLYSYIGTQNNNESKELKKSLLLAQQTASEREKEVFGLKETIRSECEERYVYTFEYLHAHIFAYVYI
jgi:hypothetical protein